MAGNLKLGMSLGYWAGGPPPGAAEAVLEADRLGFESVWTAEAYGSDALMPLAWWGSQTEQIKLGTAIVQISARTPAATAMADPLEDPPDQRVRSHGLSPGPVAEALA